MLAGATGSAAEHVPLCPVIELRPRPMPYPTLASRCGDRMLSVSNQQSCVQCCCPKADTVTEEL